MLSFFLSLLVSFLFFNISLAAYSCDPTVCLIQNNCHCASNTTRPGNLALSDTPQFVFFTLDDSIYERDFYTMDNLSFILNNASIKDSMGCYPRLSYYTMQTCNTLITNL